MIRRRNKGGGQEVSPGGWIRVPVPGDPQRLSMQVGPQPMAAAFVDKESDGDGGWVSVAARRCPDLVPGTYTVKVYGAETVVASQIVVI